MKNKRILARIVSGLMSSCLILGGLGGNVGGVLAGEAEPLFEGSAPAAEEEELSENIFSQDEEVAGAATEFLEPSLEAEAAEESLSEDFLEAQMDVAVFSEDFFEEDDLVATQETCGEKLSWTIQDNKLTISGTGPMYDYSQEEIAPWGMVNTQILAVELEEGVTSIGANAFLYQEDIKSVSLPQGLLSIGEKAFMGCTGLTSIVIPDTVTSIGQEAFSGCSSLKEVYLSVAVTRLEKKVFYGCSSLESLKSSQPKPEHKKPQKVVTPTPTPTPAATATPTPQPTASPVITATPIPTQTPTPALKKQPMKVEVLSPVVDSRIVAKKKVKLSLEEAFKITKAKGNLTFKKKSGSDQLKITKAGKIVVKKGTEIGLYTIKVKITASGTAKYASGSKTVTVKVMVGNGEDMSYMVVKEGSSKTYGPYSTREKAEKKAKKLGDGWKVVVVWG